MILCDSRVHFGSLWDHFGSLWVTLELLWVTLGHFGVTLGSLWVTLGSYPVPCGLKVLKVLPFPRKNKEKHKPVRAMNGKRVFNVFSMNAQCIFNV